MNTSQRLQVLRRGSPRIALGAAPSRVRAWVEHVLGSPIVAATTQTGGFSPGVAARVRCADGSRAFVKAVGAELNPDSPALIRREIEVLAHLPGSLPRPTVLGSYDVDGWVGLLLEDVDGALPDLPWRADQLWRVLDALSELTVVTPEPRLAAALGGEDLSRLLTTWEDFRVADRDQLDAWSRTHLEALIDQGRRAVAGLADGQTLCHVDVRSDNLLLTNDRVVLVDWNWAAIGPSWFDPALLLLELRTAGGPDPDEVVDQHPMLRAVDPELITAFVAAVTGMFLRNSRLAAPPGLPTLRTFQAAYADALLRWTKERTGWR